MDSGSIWVLLSFLNATDKAIIEATYISRTQNQAVGLDEDGSSDVESDQASFKIRVT